MKKDSKRESIQNFFGSNVCIKAIILLAVMTVFTIALYPNLFVTTHSYKVGDIADRDIKASRNFLIKNEEDTLEKRKKAAELILTVYDHDNGLAGRIKKQVESAFEHIQSVIKEELASLAGSDEKDSVKKNSIRDHIWKEKEEFEKKLGVSVSKENFKILEKEAFSKDVSDLIVKITAQVSNKGIVANKDVLLKEIKKGIVLRTLGEKKEKKVNNLKQYYDLDQAKKMVRVIGKPLLKGDNRNIVSPVVEFSQSLIQPNITLNRSETEERKKNAAAEIKPIFFKIKAGEMLLREGDRTTPEHIRKLKTLEAQIGKDKIYAKSIGAIVMILYLIIILYFLYASLNPGADLNSNRDMLFFASVLIVFFLFPKISSVLFESVSRFSPYSISASSMLYAIPLAAGSMTVCLFMGIDVAILFAILLSICTAVISQHRFEMFVFFLLNTIMGAYWLQNCRERKVFVKAGVKIGCLNILLATATGFYMGDFGGLQLMWGWIFAFIGGLAAGVITAGLAPLMEMAFGYTTDITLLELANLEQPILRRLMLEAPGTYHHSVVVGSMVEAAAADIGANPLLAKVCGYYHDIGKINKPLYFVENQADRKNKHDKLAPSMSSLILISHVKEGVETAKKHKLGQVIIDAIKQHHGTSLIKFFYEKARQLKGEDAVKIDDFRYPGPRPQTREAGLVMLADVVEAASRTLEDPTPSRIKGHVQKLINNIFSDGQLDECELTLKDLHSIAKSFNTILNGIHHHRIEYKETIPMANGKDKKEKKEKNGRSDQQSAKPEKDSGPDDPDKGSGHLKRLGVS
ncbi:HDIG domain-containing protein [Desulfobacterales bacterium HSG16]|nr:HDIG domain-containing protein [Desulfobacterales bacterium HSG16]